MCYICRRRLLIEHSICTHWQGRDARFISPANFIIEKLMGLKCRINLYYATDSYNPIMESYAQITMSTSFKFFDHILDYVGSMSLKLIYLLMQILKQTQLKDDCSPTMSYILYIGVGFNKFLIVQTYYISYLGQNIITVSNPMIQTSTPETLNPESLHVEP